MKGSGGVLTTVQRPSGRCTAATKPPAIPPPARCIACIAMIGMGGCGGAPGGRSNRLAGGRCSVRLWTIIGWPAQTNRRRSGEVRSRLESMARAGMSGNPPPAGSAGGVSTVERISGGPKRASSEPPARAWATSLN